MSEFPVVYIQSDVRILLLWLFFSVYHFQRSLSPSCTVLEIQDRTTWQPSQYTGSPVAMLSNWSKSFMDTKMTLVSDFWHLVIFRALCLAEDPTGGADFRLCGVALCCSWVLSRWWTARSSLVVGECLLNENRPLSEERKLITREVLLLCACCGPLSLPWGYKYCVINISSILLS